MGGEAEHCSRHEQHKIAEGENSHEATQPKDLAVVDALEVAAKKKSKEEPAILETVIQNQRGTAERIINVGMPRSKQAVQARHQHKPHDHASRENKEKGLQNDLDGVRGFIHWLTRATI